MNKKQIFLYCVLAVVALSLTACMAGWSPVKTPEMNGPQGCCHVTIPACWIHAAHIKDSICISKDGPAMNWIEVRHIDKEKGFPLTKVKLTDNHLITEVAEYFVAELKAEYKSATVNHLATEPAEIDGRTAFKVTFELIDPKGLVFKIIAYGLIDDANFYRILYKAPRLHYFEKDLQTFEQFAASFRIGPGGNQKTEKPKV